MNRVLVVEDELELLEAVGEELSDEGFEVSTARNGVQALRNLRQFSPDIIISDINMPEMDGYELLQRIRSDHPDLATVPIIFLTAFAQREDEIKGKRAGVDDYLTKPVDFDQLLATIECRLREVERMRALNERHLVKLYAALADQAQGKPDSGPAPATPRRAEPRPASAPKSRPGKPPAPQKGSANASKDRAEAPTHGAIFRFPKLPSLARMVGGSLDRIRDLLGEQAAEKARTLVGPRDVVSHNGNGELVVAFCEADRKSAADKARKISGALNGDHREQDLASLLEQTRIDQAVLANALTVSEKMFEAILSPEDLSHPDKFEKAINRFVETVRNDHRSVPNLMTSIGNQDARLVASTLKTPTGARLPIKYLDFDSATKSALRSAFALFGESNAKHARFQIDLLFLRLMATSGLKISSNDVVAIDVHYDTLLSPERQKKYSDRFKFQLEQVPWRTMVNVRAVPVGATALIIDQLSKPLGAVGKKRSIQIYPDTLAEHAKSQLPVACIVCTRDAMGSFEPDMDEFRALKHALSIMGAKLVLRGLEDLSEASAWSDYGFDGYLISGSQGK